jgi:hypothetical protein
VSAAPLPQSQVLHPTNIPLGDPLGVADQQDADPIANGEVDDLFGGLMLGLVDAAAVAGLHPA